MANNSVALPPLDLSKASLNAGGSSDPGSGEQGKFTVLNILPGMPAEQQKKGEENNGEDVNNNGGASSWRLTGGAALTPTEAALLQHQKVRVRESARSC